MTIHEYIVVGSGCSGAMAAQTLVEAGKQVAMLDVGMTNPNYDTAVPDKKFTDIRNTDATQYRYFIGDKAEGVVWGDIGKGAQVTPTRHHLTKGVSTYTPVKSDTFSPVESLGYGGLGIGWGLQCWEFSRQDLGQAGMDIDRVMQGYEVVAKRIGISATKDDASEYTMGELKTFMPSPDMDRNHRRIYRKYEARKAKFNHRGVFLGRTPLALATNDFGNRRAYTYQDMDFYTDRGHSAWRPWITVDQLRKQKNFTYFGGYLVTTFKEKKDYIEVTCLNTETNQTETFRCKTLVLAANPMSSARIVLRSFGAYNTKLPLLCNPYTYIPCLQPAMVGKEAEDHKLGFAQLTMFLDKHRSNFGASIASLYSYQSLLLFRIIKQIPFNFADARIIMRYLMSGLVVMGVHHPDTVSPDKYVRLVKSKNTPTGDILEANYVQTEAELATQKAKESTFVAEARRLGLFALARVNPGYGSSIHYAGTLPFSKHDKPFTLSPAGRLHGTRSVYVADSSGFNYLPAKGLTFTLLANAHVTAENALNGQQ